MGYNVKLEEPINGYTDIVIEKADFKTAIEIETGKSDWKKNIDKNLNKGFDKIIIAATNNQACQTIQKTVKQLHSLENIQVILAQSILTPISLVPVH